MQPDSTPAPGDATRSLEEALVDEYLHALGHTRASLQDLPEEDARLMMTDATRAAAQRMVEIKCRADWLRGVHPR